MIVIVEAVVGGVGTVLWVILKMETRMIFGLALVPLVVMVVNTRTTTTLSGAKANVVNIAGVLAL